MTQLLPRYTQAQVLVDPLEIAIAHREAQEARAREAVAAGYTPDADPQDLRGIPCIARGVGGASPGTSPHLKDFDRQGSRS